MSIRERAWKSPKTGKRRTAWIAEYTDKDGKRRIATFKTKREAQTFHATVVLDSKIQSDALLVVVLRSLAMRLVEIANEIEEKPGHMRPVEIDIDAEMRKS